MLLASFAAPYCTGRKLLRLCLAVRLLCCMHCNPQAFRGSRGFLLQLGLYQAVPSVHTCLNHQDETAISLSAAWMQANLRRSIGTLLMTTLALWLPLLPMFFFLWRAVQSRTGASRSKKDTTKASTPPVTFRSVDSPSHHACALYVVHAHPLIVSCAVVCPRLGSSGSCSQ